MLAYVCEQRPDFIGGPGGGLAAAWEALVGASGSANSAARRFRLRCLKAVVLLLLDEQTEVDVLLSSPADDGASPSERRQQVFPGPTHVARHAMHVSFSVKTAKRLTYLGQPVTHSRCSSKQT